MEDVNLPQVFFFFFITLEPRAGLGKYSSLVELSQYHESSAEQVEEMEDVNLPQVFFFTLVTGPRRSLSFKLSDTRVYEPQIRALPQIGEEESPWEKETLLQEGQGFARLRDLLLEQVPSPPHLNPKP